MAKVLVTAEVDDYTKWELGFRTHGDLFQSMTVPSVHYGTTGQNEIAVLSEPDDLSQYMEILNSKATEDAMEFDGVKPDTVKVFVLDQEFTY